MIRRFYFLLTAFLILFALSGTLYAAPSVAYQKPTGVLFVGDPLFRMGDFYRIVEEKLNERFLWLSVGNDIQDSYRKYYWEDKGLLKEPKMPTRQELLDFIKTIPYEQVLVLVVEGPNSDTRYTFLWYFTLSQSQANITIRALLLDVKTGTVLSDQEITQKGPLSVHGDMAAKRGCFRKAMEVLAVKI